MLTIKFWLETLKQCEDVGVLRVFPVCFPWFLHVEVSPDYGTCMVGSCRNSTANRDCVDVGCEIGTTISLSPKFDQRILVILRFGALGGGTSQNSALDRAVDKFWHLCKWRHYKCIPSALQRMQSGNLSTEVFLKLCPLDFWEMLFWTHRCCTITWKRKNWSLNLVSSIFQYFELAR